MEENGENRQLEVRRRPTCQFPHCLRLRTYTQPTPQHCPHGFSVAGPVARQPGQASHSALFPALPITSGSACPQSPESIGHSLSPGSRKRLRSECTPPRVVVFVPSWVRSEEHTSELQSRGHLVCRLLLE